MARGLFAAVLAMVSISGRAQAPVDHWEAVVQDGTMWKYLIPTFQPVGYWMSGNFADNTWDEGPAGFGYGDGDDATEVPVTTSIYLRHKFDLDDPSAFSRAVLAVDYDDGYVAYLNAVSYTHVTLPTICSV